MDGRFTEKCSKKFREILFCFCFVKLKNFVKQFMLTLNRPGFLQIGMAGDGGRFCPPPRNFCLNGPIDLKFGMWIVLGRISRYREKIRKNCQEAAQNADISIFYDSFHRNRAFTRNAIISVPDVIFQFYFHL